MFTQQDLALIHKAVSEMTIKGADAPVIAALLTKVTTEHTKITNPAPTAKKGK
jgi:hypothetical protein